MGNQHGQSKINSNSSDETDGQFSPKHLSSTKGNTLKTACLSKLFEVSFINIIVKFVLVLDLPTNLARTGQ